MGNERYSLRGPRPVGKVAGLKMEEVRARFLSTNPGKVTAAANAYTAASGELAGMQQELNDTIKYLTERWKGPAASEALKALRKLAATAEG